MSRFLAPTALAAGCLMVVYSAFGGAGSAAPRGEPEASPRLVRELHQTAQEAYESSFKLYQVGRVDIEGVYQWSRRRMEVARSAAQSHDQVVEAVGEHLLRMEDLLAAVEAKHVANATTVLAVDPIAVKFYVIEGQLLLAEVREAKDEDRR